MTKKKKTVIVTSPEVKKAYEELKSKGFDVKLTDPKIMPEKKKKDISDRMKKARQQMKEFEEQEKLEKEMKRQMGGE